MPRTKPPTIDTGQLQSDHDLLVELRTNTNNLMDEMKQLRNDIANLKKEFVTQAEFKPVRNIVYGAVAIILTAVVVAMITLVIQQGGQ